MCGSDLSGSDVVCVHWQTAIEGFLDYMRAGGASPNSIETRRHHLGLAARILGGHPAAVTGDSLLAWFARHRWANETRRGVRSTLRAFFGWAVDSGHSSHNPALELPVVKPSPPSPRPVPDRHYEEALARARPRERLMLRLAAEVGLRRAEVAVIHSRDLREDLDGWSIVVHGKGGKDRTLPLSTSLAVALLALPEGFAFPGNMEGHLSPRRVGDLVSDLLPDGWTMHKLRHRFATRAYAVDRDVFTVQDLLGHASPATTRAYVAMPRDSLRRTVEAVA